MTTQDGWHISRSVPATLLLGLITQAAAIVWTVSMMMADIQKNTEKLISFSERVTKVEDMVQSQAVSMARIDTNIQHIRGAVEKMANEYPCSVHWCSLGTPMRSSMAEAAGSTRSATTPVMPP